MSKDVVRTMRRGIRRVQNRQVVPRKSVDLSQVSYVMIDAVTEIERLQADLARWKEMCYRVYRLASHHDFCEGDDDCTCALGDYEDMLYTG